MRSLRHLALLIFVPLAVLAATREVLVGTTPTRIPRTPSTSTVLLYNNGAEDICCAQVSDGGAPPDCVPIASGGSMALDIPSNQPLHCTAPNAQVGDAGTRVLEVY
jgi:hypothetical protein